MAERFFINFSNHPFESWGEEQKKAAEAYGTLVEIPFPNIPPEWSTEEVNALADEYCRNWQLIPAQL